MFKAMSHILSAARPLGAGLLREAATARAGQWAGRSVLPAASACGAGPEGSRSHTGFRGKPGLGHVETVKEPVCSQTKLSNGKTAIVRRLEAKDSSSFTRFLERSKLGVRAFHDEFYFLRGQSKSDALVAVVDGQVVGMASIEKDPDFFCGPYWPDFLSNQGIDRNHVCFGQARLDPQFEKTDAIWAVVRTQLDAAKQAGFEHLAFETGCDMTKQLVRSMGGSVQEGVGTTWVVLPVRPEYTGLR